MSSFNPQKLFVNLIPPATSYQPIDGRRYTLTHSDLTGDLFLDIGYVYNSEAIEPKMRDEVLAEWQKDKQSSFLLIGNVHIDNGEFSEEKAGMRFNIFNKEMPTALKGIVYGERPFFTNYPSLLYAPIYIQFHSAYSKYRQILYFGTPIQFLQQILK
ncbi:staygreen family protein [Lederbergia citri]|uniref:Staygreen family protein n=1 Tax=Lederbergia citri TaxID=2833580 RepID=A0A942TL21_9BACI|nr:staygreen family protein [Lederbergia citri]MBS4197924.1 staygreen family protein [Lederbergia citri]